VSDLRASDEERDRAAAEIRAHFAAGRLSDEELNERLDAIYKARTQGDLRTLRSDLPALAGTPDPARAELAERRRKLRGDLIQQTGGAFVPFLICTVIWAFSGADGSFWPIWVALFPVVVLIKNGWALYGPSPQLDELEKQERDRRRRER
jgi:hypothetical protein